MQTICQHVSCVSKGVMRPGDIRPTNREYGGNDDQK